MTSRTMSETTVRVLLFNEKTELFLQEVDIPGKPHFYITPGGRVDGEGESLLEAARREVREETGFRDILITTEEPLFTGTHEMQRGDGVVALTEHFFMAWLGEEDDQIVKDHQSLTPEEHSVFTSQRWFQLKELASSSIVHVPVNLKQFAEACLSGAALPAIDFSDPKEFG